MAIGIGVLGFAHGHVNTYCAKWRDRPELGIKVVAGWDHDAARREKAAADFGLSPYEDAAAMLADPEIVGVVISSETSRHADLAEMAADAGKAIVLQKPMALTMGEADRIVDAVQRNGVPFTLAWQMRVDPQNVKMKELLQSGELGKIFLVRRRHGLPVHQWPHILDSWHNTPELNRDMWADDAAHAIDFLHWLLGVPETVTAEMETIFNPRLPNDNGVALYRYPGGPLAEVSCSFTCAAAENTTEIFAEKGSIVQNFGDVPSCRAPRGDQISGLKWYMAEGEKWTTSDIPSPANHGERIAGLAEPLAEFFHGRRPALATAEEGRTSLRMTLACYVSSRQGCRVRIDSPDIAGV